MVKSSKHIPTADRLHFFKILLPGFSTQRLRIPQNFVQHISREAYKFVSLEDSTGNHWQVKLSKTTDGTFIEDGWQHFVEDHSLYNNNFLMFGYDGNTCFNVSIFDESACERYYACSVNPNQEHVLSSGAKKSHASSEICTDCVQKTSKDDTDQHLSNFKPNEVKRAKREDVLLTHEPFSETIGSSSRRRPATTTRMPATEEEATTVLKEAEFFTSKFPYFLRCLNATNVVGSYLYIPRDFVRKHISIQKKRKVTLWNKKGQAWKVTISCSTRKGTTICAGWRAFVCGNKLEEADICIFELVSKSEMQVYIFRAKVKKGKSAVEE